MGAVIPSRQCGIFLGPSFPSVRERLPSGSYNNRIRKIVHIGQDWVVSTIAGTNTAGSADGTNSQAQVTEPCDTPGAANVSAPSLHFGQSIRAFMAGCSQ
jgi:hypothetical protein